jgi:Protein of unknown function (DUF3501)
MLKLTRSDIKSNEEYLKERDDRRRYVIALKKSRRIEVGDKLSLTFENRETIKYQIQEMMRVERISEEDKIQFEIDIYNQMIPDEGSLSATLFIEIPEMLQIKPILDTLQGLDQKGMVCMTVDGEKVLAEFEPGHSNEDRISAVHYLRFPMNKDQIHKFPHASVEIQVQHPAYQASTVLTETQKNELANDFQK